jgi:hypothetical protein
MQLHHMWMSSAIQSQHEAILEMFTFNIQGYLWEGERVLKEGD